MEETLHDCTKINATTVQILADHVRVRNTPPISTDRPACDALLANTTCTTLASIVVVMDAKPIMAHATHMQTLAGSLEFALLCHTQRNQKAMPTIEAAIPNAYETVKRMRKISEPG